MTDESLPNLPKKPKKKLGRPKLPKGAGKEFTLRVRMPLSMKEDLSKAATDENMTASELIRKLLLEHLRKC